MPFLGLFAFELHALSSNKHHQINIIATVWADRHNLSMIAAAIAFYKVTEMMHYAVADVFYEIGRSN